MSPERSRWAGLGTEIEDARQSPAHSLTALENSILRRVQALAGRGHCSPNAIGWIGKIPGRDHRKRITFKDAADGRDGRGHPAVRLSGLQHLADGALLTFSIETDCRRSTLLSYSVSIQGLCRAALPERPWYSRIDLTEKPVGQGPCGHPALHCHVGGEAETKGHIDPRVPLPWLAPGDALDWLLATTEPRMEPPFSASVPSPAAG